MSGIKPPEARLSLSTILKISALLSVLVGLITSIVAYIHADVTIPKIMIRVEERIEEAIEKHRSRDLGNVESAIKEFKQSTDKRLERIETKLDRR